jgi:transketolase
MSEVRNPNLGLICAEVRRQILDVTHATASPHLGSCFSCVEALVALYFSELQVTAETLQAAHRDRFFLSKGHACLALYTVLNKKGFLPDEVYKRYGISGGTLEHHQKRNPAWGIESSGGSLGHGLSLAAGAAWTMKLDASIARSFVLLSDGELNEGSSWEAVLFAAQHKLDNLIALVDYNKIQALGRCEEVLGLEPLGKKFEAFGWAVSEVQGNDVNAVVKSLKATASIRGKPQVLILHTFKGQGVSFMRDTLLWHYRCPDEKELAAARQEIDAQIAECAAQGGCA